MMTLSNARVLVTGGCSFIGSHLVERLLERKVASLRVVDDLSTGRLENIRAYVDSGRVELLERDLTTERVAADAMRGIDVVFHLAALHGGRGFIERNEASCSKNLLLDALVWRAACEARVAKYVYASSACVYPVDLQSDPSKPLPLREPMVGPPYAPDGVYGWAKLSGEIAIRASCQAAGVSAASCRIFTAYGERCLESHAVIAMIGRAFLGLDPFEVWGTGEQIRNWTYVGDVVAGLLAAAERIDDGSAVNVGSEEPVRVIDAARLVLELTGHRAEIALRLDMPTGPQSRTASFEHAKSILGWEPKVRFRDGLARTIEWYYAANRSRRDELARTFERKLLER